MKATVFKLSKPFYRIGYGGKFTIFSEEMYLDFIIKFIQEGTLSFSPGDIKKEVRGIDSCPWPHPIKKESNNG